MGIVTALWEKSIELARERNYQTMVAEASTPITGHVLAEKLGFEEVASVDFETFQFEGTHPFKVRGRISELTGPESSKRRIHEIVYFSTPHHI